MHQYSPGKKFPSLPQISGESRIPLPQATPPSSHLPVLSHGKPPLASPVGAKMSRLVREVIVVHVVVLIFYGACGQIMTFLNK